MALLVVDDDPIILRLMEGMERRDAFFKSVVAYAEPGREPVMFSGVRG